MASAPRGLPSRGLIDSLRTARAAAIAGLAFAVAFAATLLLFRSAFPVGALADATTIPSPEALERSHWALIILPYVAIAFIWFMAALTYNLGHADNRLFTTVFLSSGITFVVLVCVAGAVASAEIETLAAGIDVAAEARAIPGSTVNALLTNYAARMAAVFCLSLATFGRVRRLLPGWLTLLGTLTGLFLLLVPLGFRYVEYVFPAWIAVLSIYLIIADPGGKWRAASAEAEDGHEAPAARREDS